MVGAGKRPGSVLVGYLFGLLASSLSVKVRRRTRGKMRTEQLHAARHMAAAAGARGGAAVSRTVAGKLMFMLKNLVGGAAGTGSGSGAGSFDALFEEVFKQTAVRGSARFVGAYGAGGAFPPAADTAAADAAAHLGRRNAADGIDELLTSVAALCVFGADAPRKFQPWIDRDGFVVVADVVAGISGLTAVDGGAGAANVSAGGSNAGSGGGGSSGGGSGGSVTALGPLAAPAPTEFCVYHGDGATRAALECRVCDLRLCVECDKVRHLNPRRARHARAAVTPPKAVPTATAAPAAAAGSGGAVNISADVSQAGAGAGPGAGLPTATVQAAGTGVCIPVPKAAPTAAVAAAAAAVGAAGAPSFARSALDEAESELHKPRELKFNDGCLTCLSRGLRITVDIAKLHVHIDMKRETGHTVAAQAQLCRFCGGDLPNQGEDESPGGGGSTAGEILNVCHDEECREKMARACRKLLPCGHQCIGCRDEAVCLPCVYGCQPDYGLSAHDKCRICSAEDLCEGPCVQLECGHVFHYGCIDEKLRYRWELQGPRISFAFMDCPLCRQSMHSPVISHLMEPLLKLKETVEKMVMLRLEYENLANHDALKKGGAFYGVRSRV